MAHEALSYAVAVDWDNDGTYEADEADRLESWHSRRGRDALLRIGANGIGLSPGMSVGEWVGIFDNSDGRFDPWNVSGPLYGDLAPLRKAYVTVTPDGGSAQRILTGRVTSIDPIVSHPRRQVRVTIQGLSRDVFDTKVAYAVQSSYRVDQAIATLLSQAGWAGSTDLDTDSDTIPYWWGTGEPVADQIHNLVASEFGLAYEAVDGTFTFKSRHGLFTDTVAFTISDSDIAKQVKMLSPWQMLVKRAEVLAKPRVQQSSAVIWDISDPIFIAAGDTLTFEAVYEGDRGPAPANDIVTPVASTDFVLNVNSDGSGSDLTGDATVTLTDKGTLGLYQVTNGSGSDGYITTLQVRGKLLLLEHSTTRYAENSGQGRVLTLDFLWQQDLGTALSYAQWLAGWLATVPMVPDGVVLRGQWDKQFNYDLGSRLTLDLDSLGLTDDFRIGEIRHSSGRTPQDVETTYTLEAIDASRGFVLPAKIPAETRLTY